jgi:hypothetical protein
VTVAKKVLGELGIFNEFTLLQPTKTSFHPSLIQERSAKLQRLGECQRLTTKLRSQLHLKRTFGASSQGDRYEVVFNDYQLNDERSGIVFYVIEDMQ